jgi:tetraacyldisaccharide 4'-kinase
MKNRAKQREQLKKKAWGRALLWVAATAYGAVVLARRWLYELGVFKSKRLPAKVICIGNLTTGGTGKTPAVLLAATTLRRRNHAVAILSRGYGRKTANGEVLTLLDEEAPPWTKVGDEPWMMHQALHGQNVPILVSPDRVKAGEVATSYYHSRLLILDDGFQHLKLKRDLDIVLLNALDPFGGGSMLPLGNLREPVRALSRAHMIVVTHSDRVPAEELETLRKIVSSINPKAPILEAAHKPDFILDVKSGKKTKLDLLKGKKVVSLCGLGEPKSFEEQLLRMGAEIAQKWRYPDHHPYTPAEIRSAEKLRHGLPIVTTFKDFTRFPKDWRHLIGDDVYVLGIKLEILKGRNVWIDTLLKLAGTPAHEPELEPEAEVEAE